jgi:hypothetical protein
MKTKLLVTAALLFSVFLTANAQIEKGTWIIGGQAAYNQTKNDATTPMITDQKNNAAVFNVSIGTAIRQNNILGIALIYAPQKSFYTNNSTTQIDLKGHTKGVGVFYRAYKQLGNDFYLFGQGDALYSNLRSTNNVGNKVSITGNSGSISFTPGISYAVLRNVHMELAMPGILGINYSKTKSDTEGVSAQTNQEAFNVYTNLNSGLLENFGIGFKIFL